MSQINGGMIRFHDLDRIICKYTHHIGRGYVSYYEKNMIKIFGTAVVLNKNVPLDCLLFYCKYGLINIKYYIDHTEMPIDYLVNKINNVIDMYEISPHKIYLPMHLIDVFGKSIPLTKLMEKIASNNSVPEELFEKIIKSYLYISRKFRSDGNMHYVWFEYISQNSGLSENFFERYNDKMIWTYLSKNPALSEAFFEKHLDKVYWTYLSKNENMSMEFFERHIDKISWSEICKNKYLPEAFYEKYIDKLNWQLISANTNPNLSDSFYKRHLSNLDINILCANPIISDDVYECMIEQWGINGVNWDRLLKYSSISDKFIEKYISKINTIRILNPYYEKSNTSISSKMIEKCIGVLDYSSILAMNITEELLEKISMPVCGCIFHINDTVLICENEFLVYNILEIQISKLANGFYAEQ